MMLVSFHRRSPVGVLRFLARTGLSAAAVPPRTFVVGYAV